MGGVKGDAWMQWLLVVVADGGGRWRRRTDTKDSGGGGGYLLPVLKLSNFYGKSYTVRFFTLSSDFFK